MKRPAYTIKLTPRKIQTSEPSMVFSFLVDNLTSVRRITIKMKRYLHAVLNLVLAALGSILTSLHTAEETQ